MNGRAPAYKKCNEITLVKMIGNGLHFVTFWKNVHQQYMITVGQIYGCTYMVTNNLVTDKESGNYEYIEYRKNGWVKFTDYCKQTDSRILIQEFGEVVY